MREAAQMQEPHALQRVTISPSYFVNRRTGHFVLAHEWEDTQVRFFYHGKKYDRNKKTGDHVFMGTCSKLMAASRFYRCYKPSIPDKNNQKTIELSAKKRCARCGKHKFLIEFRHDTRQRNQRMNICSQCLAESKERLDERVEIILSLDRSKKRNFIKYMKKNPLYFRDTFELEPTPKNYEIAYQQAMTCLEKGIFDE